MSVEYIADLAHSQGLEHVSIVGPSRMLVRGQQIAVLHRHGKPMARFIVSAQQARKIRSRRGKLSITSKMIAAARLEESPYGRDRSSRARRGPKDEGMRLAKSIAKWSPAGSRMKPEAKLAWRERHLKDALARHGVPWRAAFHEVLVDQMIKEDHRSSHARYVRAYGSSRDRGRRRRG